IATPPFVPSLTVTRLAIVSAGPKFKLDAVGVTWPAGEIVNHPDELGPVTATFITTASASAGTPETPPTCRTRVWFGANAPDSPVRVRVSRMRVGVTPVNRPAGGVVMSP